jgi:hypothetical protein
MSTLVAQTISNGTVSTSSENVIQGSAKAWVCFDGTGTPAILGSFNVSSITDNGTGDYTVNFTNAFANANYSAVTMAYQGVSGSQGVVSGELTGNRTASNIRLRVSQGTSNIDLNFVNLAVFR